MTSQDTIPPTARTVASTRSTDRLVTERNLPRMATRLEVSAVLYSSGGITTASATSGSSRRSGPGRTAYASPARVRNTASGSPDQRASFPMPTTTKTVATTYAIDPSMRPLSGVVISIRRAHRSLTPGMADGGRRTAVTGSLMVEPR